MKDCKCPLGLHWKSCSEQYTLKRIHKLIPATMDIETLLKENDEYTFQCPKDKLGYFLRGVNFALIKVKGIIEEQLND